MALPELSKQDKHRVHEIVLTIVNDGNGDQCGYTYRQRRELADTGLYAYRHMVRNYLRHSWREYGTPRPVDRRVRFIAADEIQAYYRRHVAEG